MSNADDYVLGPPNILTRSVFVNAIPAEYKYRIGEHYGGWGSEIYDLFSVEVALRGNYWNEETESYDYRYAVVYRMDTYDADLKKAYEDLPSSRTDEYKERFRFPFEEAVALAHKLSSQLRPYILRNKSAAEMVAGLSREDKEDYMRLPDPAKNGDDK